MDRGDCQAMVYGVTRVGHDGTTEHTHTQMPLGCPSVLICAPTSVALMVYNCGYLF